MRIAKSACTSFPNTKETDLLPEVAHDVTVRADSGLMETVRLMASDPVGAIYKVNTMSDHDYELLERI